ncbi:bifunctional diaminohydroxyphosphoribosylaminopyrimidine deaminase/5-amino-6-(5-phosphoribosylamino)uracil reductase RibD [Angustibacter peucedani]
MTSSAAGDAHVSRALELARRGPAAGPNPRVGCVVLAPDGRVVGEGWHEGAGTPHAEVAALADGDTAARGGTAVVSLEPCGHTGRTGPCTAALITAGVAQVLYARPDSTPDAGGGAERLRQAGIDVRLVDDPEQRREADELVRWWQLARDLGRPVVTWKLASTLDGRSAAADGTSRWITGPEARADVHALRAEVDVVLVGTGTAWDDDPRLTVRDPGLADAEREPQRAVMGLRGVRPGSALDAPGVAVLDTRDPADALRRLWDDERRHVLLEGGPSLAAAFWRSGLVDRVVAYVAPALLGAGVAAVADLGTTSIDDAARLELDDVTRLGDDVRLTLTPRRSR